jgi:hypothetical protein
MTKVKHIKNAGSTTYKPVFGKARHDQIVRAAWAAERHGTGSGAAKQARGKRKPGSYSVR